MSKDGKKDLKIKTDLKESDPSAFIPEIKLIDPTTTLEDEAFPTPMSSSKKAKK